MFAHVLYLVFDVSGLFLLLGGAWIVCGWLGFVVVGVDLGDFYFDCEYLCSITVGCGLGRLAYFFGVSYGV